MALFRAYFDDSGTHGGSPVVVFGGLIGLDTQWEPFDAKWRAKLAAPLPDKPRLRKFHLSSCMAPDGEFRDYKPVERQAVAGEFRDIIIESGLGSTASAVDTVAWDELVVGPVRRFLGSALQPCFLHCLDRAMEYARAWGTEGDQIAVMFDKGTESDELHSLIDKYLWNQSEIVSVTFGRVEKFTPLQGADVVATESYWQAQYWLGGNTGNLRPPFDHYLKHAKAEGLIFDRQTIIEELKRRDERGFLKARAERDASRPFGLVRFGGTILQNLT
ncbi:MAG: DUF3800 domain-containing protein [Xanthobacteraceae bacterium]|jgi:hypothetical protein